MTDTKISSLTDLAAEPASDDKFPIVDTSAVTTKRVDWSVIKAIFPTHALATAANDFLIASGSGAWAKQTLAQAKATLGIQDAAADGATKGLAAFTAADFNASSGLISIDYTNAQKASTSQAGLLTELATTAEIDTGTDSTRAIPVDQFVASTRNVRYLLIRVVDSATNCATATTKGGDIEAPFTGTITEIGAYVDTAGVTGTMTVDVNKNGTTIMTTNKITIDTAEKSSRTAATAPALTTTAVTAGDLLTIDIDAIQTTPAKGLTVRVGIRMT